MSDIIDISSIGVTVTLNVFESVFSLDVAREKYSKYLKIVLSSDHVSKEKIHNIKEIISNIKKNNFYNFILSIFYYSTLSTLFTLIRI